jgi:hypothetical protein
MIVTSTKVTAMVSATKVAAGIVNAMFFPAKRVTAMFVTACHCMKVQ